MLLFEGVVAGGQGAALAVAVENQAQVRAGDPELPGRRCHRQPGCLTSVNNWGVYPAASLCYFLHTLLRVTM